LQKIKLHINQSIFSQHKRLAKLWTTILMANIV
jgi:hypothetical protein